MTVAPWAVGAALGVLGLVVGSFLTVVVERVPAGLSVVAPGSACPRCGHPVRVRDNVPVLSWLALRGRCRDCATPIPLRYPLVEAGTGLLFVAVGWRTGPVPALGAALAAAAGGLALAVVDLRHGRLPFALTGATAGVVVAALALDALLRADAAPAVAVASCALWLAVYGGTWAATGGRGMGLGDVALAPLLGLVLGWWGWAASLVGLLAGFVLGAAFGVALVLAGRARRRTPIPYGPFMLAGAALGFFGGGEVADVYLTLVGWR